MTSLFKWRQFRFKLDALVVVEIDVIVNEPPGLLKSGHLLSVDTFRFEDRKEVFSQSIVVRIPAS